VDDAVGDGFADSRFDIAELLQRRVELGGEARHGRAGKTLVGGPA
jgi:hypothetical protein